MAKDNTKRALAVVSLATSVSLFGDSALYAVLPSQFSRVGVALASVGILLSINRFIRVLLNGPVGALTDRWPRRRVFVPAVFLGAASTAMYALSHDFWPMLVGRLIWGLAWSGIWVAGNAIVLDISTAADRGTKVGRYQFAFFLGAASGALLGGSLTDLLDFHRAMWVASALTLSGAMVALLLLPETSWRRAQVGRILRDKEQVKNTRIRPQLASATALYSVNRLVVAGIMLATFGLYLSEKVGPTAVIGNSTVGVATLTGIALGSTTLIGMVAAPIAGWLSDRFVSRWGTAAGGLAFGVTGFTLLSRGTAPSLFAGLPLVSLSSGSNQGISTSLIGDLSPRFKHGRRLGIFFTAGDLASAAGPTIAYSLLPVVALSTIYIFCAGMLGAMMLVCGFWGRRTRLDYLSLNSEGH